MSLNTTLLLVHHIPGGVYVPEHSDCQEGPINQSAKMLMHLVGEVHAPERDKDFLHMMAEAHGWQVQITRQVVPGVWFRWHLHRYALHSGISKASVILVRDQDQACWSVIGEAVAAHGVTRTSRIVTSKDLEEAMKAAEHVLANLEVMQPTTTDAPNT